MSEQADYLNEQMMADPDLALGFGRHPRRRGTKKPKCMRCGARAAGWKQTRHGRWWMVEEDGSWHKCVDVMKETLCLVRRGSSST